MNERSCIPAVRGGIAGTHTEQEGRKNSALCLDYRPDIHFRKTATRASHRGISPSAVSQPSASSDTCPYLVPEHSSLYADGWRSFSIISVYHS